MATHGAVGLAIVLLVPWKSLIVRRGLERERPGRWASITLGVLVAISIGSGMLHSAKVTRAEALTTMQIHVGAALLALPLAAWHILARPARPHRTDLSRRRTLSAGGLLVAGAGMYAASEGLKRLSLIPGGDRRFTGSHEEGSFSPEEMPVTQWLTDKVPLIDSRDWTLTVSDGREPRLFSYDHLLEFDDEVRATLDCTGGWYAKQVWRGVALRKLFPNPRGRSLAVVSVTGYLRRFPIRELGGLLLAIQAGGQRLAAGHGFPLRLVAPGRRGFWWVKWVSEVKADDTPWWWQPPFPLR